MPPKQLRLALVTETFPPETNGVAMTWGHLVRELANAGHSILLIRPRQKKAGPLPAGVAEETFPGFRLPKYRELQFGLPSGRRLARRLRAFAPDIVHIVTEGPLGWHALCTARRLKLPVTSSFHTNFHAYGKHYGLGAFSRLAFAYLRGFHNRTAATFAPTNELCQQLSRSGIRHLHVLGRGIDRSRFHPCQRSEALRKSWGASADTVVFLYVGRLAAEKNIPLAVEAYLRARESLADSRFVLVGDGPLRQSLQEAHTDFIFAGPRFGSELGEHYASGDVFLSPSKTETFGNVVTEALAAGLCVLSFDYAAARQYIRDGENGHTVPLGDDAAFIGRAVAIAQNPALLKYRDCSGGLPSWSEVAARFVDDLQDCITECADAPTA